MNARARALSNTPTQLQLRMHSQFPIAHAERHYKFQCAIGLIAQAPIDLETQMMQIDQAAAAAAAARASIWARVRRARQSDKRRMRRAASSGDTCAAAAFQAQAAAAKFHKFAVLRVARASLELFLLLAMFWHCFAPSAIKIEPQPLQW